uniref:Uncharacterized protein n=1 Tax=Glossina brevipalpis TaxID=37001 RepID=A0A3F2Z3F9_9MUSC
MTTIFKGIFLLLSSLLLIAAQNPQVDKKLKKQALRLHDYCVKKVDSNTEYLLDALFNKTEHTDAFKCYLHCIYDTFGLVSNNNEINALNMLPMVPPEYHDMVVDLHSACDTQPGKDACDIVYATAQCYYRFDPR